jgi:integrase
MLQRIKYVHAYVDRHGHVRAYFRKRGRKTIALPAPGTPGFLAAYTAALKGTTEATAKPVRRDAVHGSVDATVGAYYASAGFLGLRASSQRSYRRVLEAFRLEHGDKPIALLNRKGLQKLMAAAPSPNAANYLRRILRVLLQFAVAEELRDDNPAIAIKPLKVRSDGYHAWTEEEIEQFERHWPIGTLPRLAMALQLFTGQRASDVIRMTWRDVKGPIPVRQVKTDARLSLPVHPELRRVLDGSPKHGITMLVSSTGARFNADIYTGWFGRQARAAGLTAGCSSHGLRKAAARRLAEAGCTVHQIAAITGHRSLKEIERYTRDADQARMAQEAMNRLGIATKENEK